MKNNYFLQWTQRLFFLLIIINGLNTNAQSFLITFPNHATTPTQNPRNLTVCNGTSLLKVRLDLAAASAAGANVTVQLPAGVEYIAGTITKTGGTAALTITDNGGGANAPNFLIGPSALALGQFIEFTIDRRATCPSRTASIAGTVFSDVVTGTIPGNSASTATSSAYQLFYPVFSLTQPATQTNAIMGQTYTRNFTISNGGNGCATEVHFSIDNPASGIQQTSITLGGVIINPTSTVGTTSYYTVTAANLPGGDFCFGETLTFTETYVVKACGAVSNYSAGWGCSSAPASWCRTITGSGNVTMANGVPNFSSYTIAKTGYVDNCTPFTTTATYKNTGAGNATAATMFNTVFRIGGGSIIPMDNYAFNYLNFLSATIGGMPVTLVGGTTAGILSVNVNNVFPTTGPDPDGVGVGLEDVDGDGFYDDLPPGNTVTIVFTTKINCSAYSCPQQFSLYYGPYGDVQYTTMCSNTVTTATKIATTAFNAQFNNLSNKSYAPANIYDGVPFAAIFSVGYTSLDMSTFDTANTRYQYVITLPAGVSYIGTPAWHYGQYPNNASTAGLTPVISQSGNVLTITSPDKFMGWFSLTFVYNCAGGAGGVINIPYTLKRLDNIVTNCITCNSDLFCSNLVLSNVVCPAGPCRLGGVALTFTKVERADNSLGWTDNTLATRQLRSAISSYDLSKALYLDEIGVTANGTQKTISSNNVFVRFNLNKTTGTDNKLTPLNIAVTIKRAGIIQTSGTLTSFVTTASTTTNQIIDWDLTALVPAGGLLPDDTIETFSRYTVSSTILPTHDIQMGKEIYLYNKDTSGNKLVCSSLLPEIYLVAPVIADNNNNSSATSCNLFNVINGTNYYAYRFDAAGTQFLNEVRPGFLPTSYEFTLPAGYIFDRVTNPDYGVGNLTPTSVVGSTYHFDLAAKTFPITVVNNYSTIFTVYAYPSCATQATENYNSKLTYIPYYYHHAGTTPLPATTTIVKNVGVNYVTASKPTIALANQTGTIQASRPNESFVVRMSNTSTSTAPYTWISIPTIAGVTITQVVDVSTNTVLTPTAYSGGVWFPISATGLSSGTFKDYKINFTYTECSQKSFAVNGGWNCNAFPTDPDNYICGTSSVLLPFIPQTAQVQIIAVNQPTAPVSLCTPIPFEYRMNSAGAGNAIDTSFIVDLPAGMSYAGALEAEYPVGSGNWTAVTSTTAGTQTTVDLTTHPNFPIQGLPGTLTDLGDANSRLIGLRFSLNTNCDFIAGSNINIFAKANRSCGTPAIGNGTRTSSLDINIDGVTVNYLIDSNIAPKAGSFNNCNSPVVFGVTQTVVSPTPIGATASTQIIIPEGYEYVAGTFVCNDPDTSSAAPYTCPTYLGTFTNVAGQDYIELSIPSGSVSGDRFDFDFTIQKTDVVACGNYSLLLQTVDKVASVTCPSAPGGVCTNFTVQTGSKTFDYTVSNPILNITALTATHNAGTYTGSITVANTSAINQTNSSPANPVQVSFFCADALRNPTGTILGTHTMTGPIAAGATVTENYTLSGASTCGLGKIVAVISTDNNCICDTVIKALDLLPIATNDSQCYTQGALSTTVNVLANDTTGDTIVPTTVSLVVPPGATGVITDVSGDVVSMTITGQGTWSVNATTGEIVFVPLTNTTLNPTPVQYNGDDTQGNASNNATITLTTTVVKIGTETTTCLSSGYTLSVEVNGLAPYTVTGTGAPGTWSGNTWTSSTIATGTNYNVSINDVNSCNTLVVSGTAPVCCVFQVNCPTFTTTTVACYANIPTATTLTEAQFEALGNADGIIGNNPCGVIVITASNAASPACEGNVIRTYTITEYTDPNNNDIRDLGEDTVLNTQDCAQTYTIERLDFTMPANQGSTVACAALVVAPTVPAVTDNCGNTLTASAPVVSSTPACEGDVTYTYTFTDCEGNTHDWVYTYTIERLDFTMPVNESSTVACAALVVAPTVPAVTDNCGNVLTASAPVVSATPACEGDVTYTYTFTDCEGTSHDWVYTYTIERLDFTMPANQGSTVACAALVVAPTVPAVTDNCGNTLTASAPVVSATPACEGDVTYTYTFTDCEGTSHDWVYTYTIERLDFTMPVNESSTVACAALVVAPTVPAVTDNCGNVLTASAPVVSATPACEGDVTYTYTFTDCEGTSHDWVYTYTIERLDFTMPVNESSTVACAALVVAPTVPAVTDNCGNVLTASAPVVSATPACEGDVTYTYTFTDCEGTSHDWVYTYTIERLDFTMPANQGSTVACAALVVAPTVPAVTDNCGNVLTASAPVVSATPACEGDVTYTYTFTDCEGTSHDWVYTYTIDDTIAPTGTTPSNLTFKCITDVLVADITAVTDESDNCLGVVTVTVTDTNNGGTGCLGNPYIVTRTYTLTDCAGNTTNLVQTITVVDDTDPIFVEVLPTDVVLECTDVVPTAPTLTATDNCSTATVVYDEQRTDGSCPSNYTLTRTWTATDTCGNETTHIQMIDVQDTTAPVFTGDLPVDGFADCDNIPLASTVTATDNCGNVTITLDEQRVDGDCSSKYELIRTWTATDDCNNSSTYVQTITLACHIEVFNAVTPNGDTKNNIFHLEGIDCYPNNTVEIYNRWGIKVYETIGYDNVNKVFEGYSDGRSTISRNELLPTGTYFYILKYEYSFDGVNGKQNIDKSGYLYIQNN